MDFDSWYITILLMNKSTFLKKLWNLLLKKMCVNNLDKTFDFLKKLSNVEYQVPFVCLIDKITYYYRIQLAKNTSETTMLVECDYNDVC